MKKIISFFSAIILICIVCLCGCEKKGSTVKYYYPENTSRITREQKLDGDGQLSSLNICLAKNEYEGSQFIVNSDFDMVDLCVKVGELKNTDGLVYDPDNITVSREFYQDYDLTYQGKGPNYPDALIPMYDGSDGGFENDKVNVNKGENQAFWIRAYADENTQAGIYTGNITITYKDNSVEMPIEIEVWDITIPKEQDTTLDSYYGYWEGMTNGWYDTYYPGLITDYTKLNNEYLDFFRNYRMGVGPDIFEYKDINEYLQKIKEQLESKKTKHFEISRFIKYKDGDTVDNFIDNNKDFLQAVKDAGLIKYAYIYSVDEPSNQTQFDQITITRDALRKMGYTDLRQLTTYHYEEGKLEDVSYWCPTLEYMSKDFLRMQKSIGNDSSWYGWISTGDDCTVSYHTLSWLSKYMDNSPYLQWSINIFKKFVVNGAESNSEYVDRDIWKDPCDWTGTTNGAMYAFPGAEGDGVVGRNILIPTIRLEAVRDGFEETELFNILEKRYKSYIDSWNADITLDDVMYSYYDVAFVDTTTILKNPDFIAGTRKIAAEDIMNNKEAIVAVKRAINDGFNSSRDIVVYTPSQSNVVIDGVSVNGEKENGNYFYKLSLDSSTARQIEINVDGTVYHRYIMPEKDNEYIYMMTDKLYVNAQTLGMETKEAYSIANYLSSNYSESKNVIDSDEAARKLKLQSINSLSNSKLPVIIKSDVVKDSVFTNMKFMIYTYKNANISVDGIDAQKEKDFDNYSVYSCIVNVGYENISNHNISISVNDIKETLIYTVIQNVKSVENLINLPAASEYLKNEKLNMFDSGFSSVVNDKLNLKFGNQFLFGFTFGRDSLVSNDLNGYTSLRFVVSNKTEKALPPVSVKLYGDSFDKDLGKTSVIEPISSSIQDFDIPDYLQEKMNGLKSIYLSLSDVPADDEPYEYTIDGMYLINFWK